MHYSLEPPIAPTTDSILIKYSNVITLFKAHAYVSVMEWGYSLIPF
jgi:hypothetical protein